MTLSKPPRHTDRDKQSVTTCHNHVIKFHGRARHNGNRHQKSLYSTSQEHARTARTGVVAAPPPPPPPPPRTTMGAAQRRETRECPTTWRETHSARHNQPPRTPQPQTCPPPPRAHARGAVSAAFVVAFSALMRATSVPAAAFSCGARGHTSWRNRIQMRPIKRTYGRVARVRNRRMPDRSATMYARNIISRAREASSTPDRRTRRAKKRVTANASHQSSNQCTRDTVRRTPD